jgi:hypothetical protein
VKLLVIALLLASSVFAADVDGKWAGTMSTPMGDVPVAFTFKADGKTLNGTTAGPDGGDVKIADGKVDGNNISFTITFDFGGMPIVLSYKGVVTKDEIKFVIDVMGMPMELTLKKGA